MSLVYTEITIKNSIDESNAANGIIEDHAVRQTTVRALVDTGSWTLAINEAIREQLGLRIYRSEIGTLADGSKVQLDIVGPVEVAWKDRRATCDAIVMPDADEVLLGAIPLEAMDLMIHPRTEEITAVNRDQKPRRIT